MATRKRDQEQFELCRDRQWCKHLVLKKYCYPWSRILGSISDRIYVVDLCAGAGTYVDPTTDETLAEGSPVIFARRAKEYTDAHGPRRSMYVICVEPDPENYAKLVGAVEPYRPHVTTCKAGCVRCVDRRERGDGMPRPDGLSARARLEREAEADRDSRPQLQTARAERVRERHDLRGRRDRRPGGIRPGHRGDGLQAMTRAGHVLRRGGGIDRQ